MECPSVWVRTVSTPEDSEGTAEGNVYGLKFKGVGVSLRRGTDREHT